MFLDLKRPFTTADVAALISSKDDSVHRQLCVTTEGLAYIADAVGVQDFSKILFRLETWAESTKSLGTSAALDMEYAGRIEKVLRGNWPNPTATLIDSF